METKRWGKHNGKVLEVVTDYNIIECEICDFKHIVPIPTEKQLQIYYDSIFYEKQKPDYFKQHKKNQKWWNIVYEERYQWFEKFLKTDGKKILDIGCGPGFFLKLGKDLGWDVTGIEPSKSASSFANNLGVNVIHGYFDQKTQKRIGKVDVIHMQGVMEHLSDPKYLVRNCFESLSSGGLFCTIVANDFNPLQKVLREQHNEKPWWIIPPEHINYFDVKSIKELMKSIGFEVKYITTTFPIEIFLLMGDNYVNNPKIGSECHDKRKKFEFMFEKSKMRNVKQKLYENLAKIGIGRDIQIICKKP